MFALAFSYAATATAWPALYVKEAAVATSQGTPAPLSAAATKTRIWSITESTVTYYQFINPRKVTLLTTKTVTSLEPWPAFSVFPTTVTEVVISHVTWEDRTTYSNGGGSSTSITSFVATVPETWVVSQPRRTDTPAGTRPDDLQCENTCAPPVADDHGGDGDGDPVCVERGLHTGCQGQCAQREEGGPWWCYQMHQRDYVHVPMRMGRACWGGDLQYRQLNTPCEAGDVAVGCVKCQGWNYTWGAVNWEGPEAVD
ncbi:hypothetical protein B0H63DRAFT_449073 [Podospora didyma]|uniref:Uncharacterized protein n=1 Tax=Podospora didyma TaxID=330526 RepID=A0AAE0NNU4_9PEZI|nr:hypothetical protein B0H63DRAFT_449073 [Podospora didyma]